MSYLERIQKCHQYDRSKYLDFMIDDEVMGLTEHSFAEQLARWSDVFQRTDKQIILNPELQTFDERTQAVAPIMEALHKEGVIDTWVDEPYAVSHAFEEAPRMAVERAAASFLGIRGYGVHINGLVKKADKIYCWVAIRAEDKPFWPGKLDQMVAGGQGIGIGLMENVIKESAEEADIPEELASQAQARGCLHYCTDSSRGIRIDTLFNYDLWLPEDFTPVNTDGEVDGFVLMSLEKMAEVIDTTDNFKQNCNLVNIDLLIRSGIIHHSHPDFKEIIALLYAPAMTF
ncbi:MAG: DUF4743 domain-containing protein [Aquificaceae bacterium]|nr:MAG: DUF4743 domain-containing protein [Aquificaceae bacterium]